MSKLKLNTFALAVFCFMASYAVSQSSFKIPKDNPIELGKVNWLRNYNEALELSKQLDKPILILFQEVPGCSTCQNFGTDVLSHPFIVESIESHFVPLAIFNNKGGHDKEILELYKEPSWNNPVVRIIDSKGKEIAKRLNGIYSQAGLLSTILEGIASSNQIAPKYLQLYSEELQLSNSSNGEFYLSMYCFWTGEKELAKFSGVFKTASGFMHGQEVVKVTYDPKVTDEKQLLKKANQIQCADQLYSNHKSIKQIASKVIGESNVKKESNFRLDHEQKYYLLHSQFKNIPMTPYQAMKINSAIGSRQNPKELLSPRQIQLLKKKAKIDSKKSFEENWYEIISPEP